MLFLVEENELSHPHPVSAFRIVGVTADPNRLAKFILQSAFSRPGRSAEHVRHMPTNRRMPTPKTTLAPCRSPGFIAAYANRSPTSRTGSLDAYGSIRCSPLLASHLPINILPSTSKPMNQHFRLISAAVTFAVAIFTANRAAGATLLGVHSNN